MTQEEKQLLLKDLCARLPYEVIALKTYKEGSKTMESTSLIETNDIDMLLGTVEDMEEAHYIIKPYLRPMSSMTDEEEGMLDSMCDGVEMVSRLSGLKMFDKAFDWLYSKHLDIHGLIEKGLALEAPEGMYK